MPGQDLVERIRSLSPGALRLFRQQLATLPERDKTIAFSKLSGIAELEDITRQPAIPTAQLGAPTPQLQVQQAEQQEVPLWMKALQTVTKPFEWLQEYVATPISAAIQEPAYKELSPTEWATRFGPGLITRIPEFMPGGEAREAYEAWQAPTLETGARWPEVGPLGGGPIDISTKHILELAPWLAIPSAAGAQLALRGGGKAAQIAARALTPAVKAERAITYPIAKPLEVIGKRIKPLKTPRKLTAEELAEKWTLEGLPPKLTTRNLVSKLGKIEALGEKKAKELVTGLEQTANKLDMSLDDFVSKHIADVELKRLPTAHTEFIEDGRVILRFDAKAPVSSIEHEFAHLTNVAERYGERLLRTEEERLVGMAMPLATQREMLARAGMGRPGLSTEQMGLVYRNPQGNPIAVATLHPEPSGAIRIGSVVADEKSLLKGKAAKAILDELEKTPNVILPPVGEMSPMGLGIAEKYQQGLIRKAGLETPPPPPTEAVAPKAGIRFVTREGMETVRFDIPESAMPLQKAKSVAMDYISPEAFERRLADKETINLAKKLDLDYPDEWGIKFTNTEAWLEAPAWVGKAQREIAPEIKKAILEAPPPPPTKPPTATEAVPGGFTPPQAGAIAKLTQLVKETKPITKETLALRKPEQAIRVGEYERLLQQHRAQGMPTEEADRLATQALAGRYPQADITAELDVIRKGMTQDEVQTLFNIIGDAQYASSFTRRNTIQALQDLLLTNRLQQNQIRLLEETFGPKLARELLKKRPFGVKAREFVIDIANAPRSLLASCDISGLLRQGAILFARRPIEGVQTVKPMLYAMFRDKNAVLVDSIIRSRKGMDELLDPALRATLELTSIPSKEAAMLTQFEEAFASKIMNKIPFVRASNRAFVTVLNDMRSRSALSTLNNWKRAGIKYTKADVADLNQFVNWASGRGTLPKAVREQGKLLNALFFAPRLQLGRLGAGGMGIKALVSLLSAGKYMPYSQMMRTEILRTLLSFVGAGAGILTMAQLSGASDIELDPRSADFGKLRVGETRLDIWSGYAQYMRFAANLATGQKKSVGDRTYAISRKDVVDRFVRTKFSPAMGLLNDLLMGETYMGEDLPPKSAKSAVGQMYERMVPMAIQGMVDAYSQEGPIGILIGSAELLGIGAVTYTDEVKQEQNKAAQAQYGMSWDEVGKQYGKATQLRLAQTTQAILEAEKEEEKRFATGSPTITEQWQNEGQSIEDTYREMIDQAANEYRQTLDGVMFREKVNDASKYRRVSYAARAKREEYQDIVAYYNQPLEPDKIAQMNPGDVLRREYYQQMFAVDMYDEFGNYRFEEAELREQEFVKKHGQQVLDYIEEYRGSIWLDKPIELKTFEQAKEILRPYWRIADAIWSLYPPQLKALADQIQILERTNPEMARRVLKGYPQILRARELIAQYRKMAREQNPRINQAYRMYYSY